MNIENTPVSEFLTCPLFGMQRAALAVTTSDHPVLDILALATSGWKPMCSFQSEDVTFPACNGTHRPHPKKELAPAQEPKPAKTVPRKNVKKPTQPDSKLEVPSQLYDPDDEPMVASGPSSTCSHLKFSTALLSHLLGHEQAQICACHPCTKRQVMLIFSVSFQLPTT